jgi:phage-related protein
MVYIKHSGWVVGYADHRAEKEVEKLAEDVRAHLERIVDLIERYGLEHVHAPYVKHISGKLWEIRAKGKDGIARALYVTAVGKQVIILHAFVKKTPKTLCSKGFGR